MSRNPISAQQPAPPYQNDPTGFWGLALEESRVAGIGSLLPAGTVVKADTAVKARLLAGQIAWTPAKARWKGSDLQVSLSDAQFFQALEEGGTLENGRLTVLVSKAQFNTGWPEYDDTFKIQAGGKWHEFVIAEMLGQNDDNEPGLLLFLDKDQDDLGD